MTLIMCAQIYFGWHWLLAERVGVVTFTPSSILAAWTVVIFLALYAAQAVILSRQSLAPKSRLYDWIYAGLYLDERYTRLTFRLWPARVPSADPENLIGDGTPYTRRPI
jgi:NAD(P)H-quinone oxidoreductase subunit 5